VDGLDGVVGQANLDGVEWVKVDGVVGAVKVEPQSSVDGQDGVGGVV
jgi:hypothetical protein